MSTLSAEVAVVSLGKNSYGHPDPTVISRWETSGALLLQTQDPDDNDPVHGTVTIETDGTTGFTATTGHGNINTGFPLD